MTHDPVDQARRRAGAFQHAAVASQIIMVVIVLTLVDRLGEPPVDTKGLVGFLFPVLALLAVFDLALAAVLPRLLLRAERLRAVMLQVAPSASWEQASHPVDGRVQRLRAGLEAALGPYLIRLALLESVAVYGVVLSLLTLDPRYCIGFVVVALAVTMTARFDTSAVEEVYRRVEAEDAWRVEKHG